MKQINRKSHHKHCTIELNSREERERQRERIYTKGTGNRKKAEILKTKLNLVVS